MNINHYTYRVNWSPENSEHVGLCVEFPSLSWLSPTPDKALSGIRRVFSEIVVDMQAAGRAEQGVSINHLASAKLAV